MQKQYQLSLHTASQLEHTKLLIYLCVLTHSSDTAVLKISNTMESGFEDDFAPMQSSNGVVAEDSSFILGQDEPEVTEESPKKNSEGGKKDRLDHQFIV